MSHISLNRKSWFSGNITLILGSILMLLILIPSFLSPILVEKDQLKIMAGLPNRPPDAEHPLGTQSEGRDILALILVGTPATLKIGLIGGAVGLLIGIFLGLISGYFGGKLDFVIRNVVDIGLTIPSLAILIMIAAAFRGLSLELMGLVVASTSWMQPTRIIRSQVLTLKERNFVKLATLSGENNLEILFTDIMPNLLPILAASFVDAFSTAILASIGLEVLGLGSQQAMTLGNTLYYSIYYSAIWRGIWWWWLPPIIILVVIFLSLFLVSTALDKIANPKLRQS